MIRLLCCSSLALALVAQTPIEALHPRLKPFRTPDRNIEAPKELFEPLRKMESIASTRRMSFDEEGRETCDDPEWKQAREKVAIKIERQAGYLLAILEESTSVQDRATALYGSLWVENPQDAFGLIARFPGEPVRKLRETAFQRAVPFVRAQWKKNLGKLGPNGHPLPKYELNLIPYAALMTCKDPLDQAQGCWFLRESLAVRPELGRELLEITGPMLRTLLVSPDKLVRGESKELLNTIDRQRRAPTGDKQDSNEALLAWLDQVTLELFPTIRPVNAGVIEIWPGKTRDELVRVGTDVLERDAIGQPQSGELKGGTHYRGFRVARLPEPLEQLRIPLEAVVTSVNGTPVATSAELLTLVKPMLARAGAVLLVEYVHKGEQHVLEYRLKGG